MNEKIENPSVLVKSEPTSYLTSMRRWTLAFCGILCVGLAALGAILPGLPTTIFLIAACYLFTRSCPRLEQILVRNRFFAAFHHYLDGEVRMPIKARVVTLAIMWTCITVSSVSLFWSETLTSGWVLLIPAAGLIGSYFVWSWGRNHSISNSN